MWSQRSRSHVWLNPLVQTSLTFVAFVALNRLGSLFMIGDGVSVFYPATAVDVVFTMHFGLWGALGVFCGAMASPWATDANLLETALSGSLNVIEGLVPWLWFRVHRSLNRDLVDLRSLFHFLVFGAILNSALSALVGNLFLVDPRGSIKGWAWFTWWLSDFSAAVLVAMPVLAFGGWIFDRIAGRDSHQTRRTIGNAVLITLLIILIGWSASAVIQNFLSDLVERDRLRQNAHREQVASLLSELERSLIEATATDDLGRREAAITSIHSASSRLRTIMTSPGAAGDALADLTTIDRSELDGSEALRRHLLSANRIRALMEAEQRAMWDEFGDRRGKTHLVSILMDQMVLLILLFATTYLMVRVAWPLNQISQQVRRLRSGEVVEPDSVHSPFIEVRNLADTLAETSSLLARKNQALIEQTSKAVAASRAKTEFLAKMSHELRTPLNSIIGFSELMLERGPGLADRKRVEFLSNISTSGNRLLELINDLLDITKIESGKMELFEHRVSVFEMVRHARDIVSPIAAGRAQRITLDVPDELHVVCDPKRIEQVVLNLLSNASKFSPEGSLIAVRARGDGRFVTIEVEDRGVGIPLDSQERIFEEFEQAHESTGGGTGLGLALVKRIVELHGGRVELVSAPGQGSTFSIHLPSDRRPREEIAARVVSEQR